MELKSKDQIQAPYCACVTDLHQGHTPAHFHWPHRPTVPVDGWWPCSKLAYQSTSIKPQLYIIEIYITSKHQPIIYLGTLSLWKEIFYKWFHYSTGYFFYKMARWSIYYWSNSEKKSCTNLFSTANVTILHFRIVWNRFRTSGWQQKKSVKFNFLHA